MFVFGDPKEVAQLLLSEVASYSGPGLPETSTEEWDYDETRRQMIYASAALRRAASNQLEPGVIEAVCDLYEEALYKFCLLDDVVWRAMKLKEHSYPWHDQAAEYRQYTIVSKICNPRLSED